MTDMFVYVIVVTSTFMGLLAGWFLRGFVEEYDDEEMWEDGFDAGAHWLAQAMGREEGVEWDG